MTSEKDRPKLIKNIQIFVLFLAKYADQIAA